MTALEEIKKSEHERIWLEPAGAPDRCWCQDNQWGEEGVEYVLASTLESLQRENEELRAALVAAKTRMRNCRGAIESDQVIDKDVHGSLQNGIRDIEAALASTGGDPLKAFDALVTGPSFTEIASTGGEHNGN